MTSTELDLAVAKAADILVVSSGGTCRRMYEQSTKFRPTTDWNDAMEAAEKFLFIVEQKQESRRFLTSINREAESGWFFRRLLSEGPRAICEAILATKGK